MVLVRPAQAGDGPAIRDAHVAAIEASGPGAYDDDAVAAWAKRDDRDPSVDGLDDPDVDVVVAERESETGNEREIAGFGRLNVDDAEVIAVYVHPDHARAGVGSALLASLEGYARGVGLSELSLLASLNAVDFYERAGYERVAAVAHETSVGVELDCVEMAKEL